MGIPTMDQLIATAGLTPVHMRHVPSQDELDEQKRAEGMQLRLAAAGMATGLLQHRQTTPRTWLKWAKVMEDYVREGVTSGDDASPVLPGAEGG